MRALLVLAILASAPVCSEPEAPRFLFRDVSPEQGFVFELRDPAKIAHARAILAGEETAAVHVMGTVVKSRAAYNPRWSYHLDPASVEFFEFAIEVCDATMQYVEEHLEEVGGAFLPGGTWCPWSSQLVAELVRAE